MLVETQEQVWLQRRSSRGPGNNSRDFASSLGLASFEKLGMQREHSEHTNREIARQVGVGRKKKSKSGEGRCNMIQVCLPDTVVFGPRQMRLGGNSNIFDPADE